MLISGFSSPLRATLGRSSLCPEDEAARDPAPLEQARVDHAEHRTDDTLRCQGRSLPAGCSLRRHIDRLDQHAQDARAARSNARGPAPSASTTSSAPSPGSSARNPNNAARPALIRSRQASSVPRMRELRRSRPAQARSQTSPKSSPRGPRTVRKTFFWIFPRSPLHARPLRYPHHAHPPPPPSPRASVRAGSAQDPHFVRAAESPLHRTGLTEALRPAQLMWLGRSRTVPHHDDYARTPRRRQWVLFYRRDWR